MSSLLATGNLPRDANKNAIQGAASGAWADATGTPITSPITAGTSEIALIAPAKAIRLYVRGLTQAIRYLSASGSSVYYTLVSSQTHSLPVKAGTTTYIGRPDSTAVEFFYELMD